MTAIKLIALDMDGTLLTSEGNVTTYTHDVIQKALKRDVHVVLCTGRTLSTSHPYAKELHLPSYIITCNGGEIWTIQEKLIERHMLEPELMEKMWLIAESHDVTMWMAAVEGVFRNQRPDDFTGYRWLKFGCHTVDKVKLEEMVKELSYLQDVELTNSMPMNIEVNPRGVHKASALQKVTTELGMTMDNVMAAGDSLNDMKMIQQAGLGVAMGNAQEAIKQAADVLTSTNEENGVAHAIEKYVLDG